MLICNECQKETPAGYFYQDFGLCWECGREVVNQYQITRAIATSEVAKALKDGRLVKANRCEICDNGESALVGHHWKGYDGSNALDVLWVCRGCNCTLRGRKYHNGSVSKEEARAIVESSRKAREYRINQPSTKKLKNYEIALESGGHRYKIIVLEAKNQAIAIDFAREVISAKTGIKEMRFLWAARYYNHQP